MSSQPIHLQIVEDDDLDAMNVRRALGHASEVAPRTACRAGVEAPPALRSSDLPVERLRHRGSRDASHVGLDERFRQIGDAMRSYWSRGELAPLPPMDTASKS